MRVPFVAALLLSAMVLPSLGATVEEVSCKADELGVRSNIIMEMVRNLTDAPLVAPIGTSSLGGSRGGSVDGTAPACLARRAPHNTQTAHLHRRDRRPVGATGPLCSRQEMGPCPAKPRTQEA